MKLIIESTDQITDINGVKVRVWNGRTTKGIACKVFVHNLAVSNGEDADEFETELEEQLAPGRVIPLRQVL